MRRDLYSSLSHSSISIMLLLYCLQRTLRFFQLTAADPRGATVSAAYFCARYVNMVLDDVTELEVLPDGSKREVSPPSVLQNQTHTCRSLESVI